MSKGGKWGMDDHPAVLAALAKLDAKNGPVVLAPGPFPTPVRLPADSAQTPEKKRTRRSKYGNAPVVVDGVRIDSKHESKRKQELEQLAEAGAITDLKHQYRIPLLTTDAYGLQHVIGHYVADAIYKEDGKTVIEDSKSTHSRTLAPYRTKVRHIRAQYGIDIREHIKKGR